MYLKAMYLKAIIAGVLSSRTITGAIEKAVESATHSMTYEPVQSWSHYFSSAPVPAVPGACTVSYSACKLLTCRDLKPLIVLSIL